MSDAELVKSKIDIVDFLSGYISLKKAGRNFKALCPFHSEKTPSFTVSVERQTWHCFGACSEGGDVITFLQKWENLEFIEALKILAEKAGIKLSNYVPSESIKLKDKLYEINHLASEYYHFILTRHLMGDKARIYLRNRGVREGIIDTFMLGYAPASWDNLKNFLQKKGYNEADILEAGLLVKSDRGVYYDRFRGRLIFTIKDARGQIIAFSGRKLPPENNKEAKYINSPETPIYIKGNTLYGLDIVKEQIKKANEAILVEGEFDMLSSFQTGVSNVAAIKGTALTEGQILLLKRYTENLVLALDSDIAGNEAAMRGIEMADSSGLNVKLVKVENGKDPDELIRKAPHLWKEAVKKPIGVYDFILQKAFLKYDKNDVWGKKKIGMETLPFLKKISNPIVKSYYIRHLAEQLEVTEDSIEESMAKVENKKKLNVENPYIIKSYKREEILEEYILALLLQSDNPKESYGIVSSIFNLDDLCQSAIKKIFEIIAVYFIKHDKLDSNSINKILTPEVLPVFNKAYLIDVDSIVHSDNLKNELVKIALEIKKIAIRREINSISTKIGKLEIEKKEPEIIKDNQQIKNLIIKLKKLEEFNLEK